jgi:hypothetical protein
MKHFSNLFEISDQKRRKQEIEHIADQTFDLFDDATKTVFEELEAKLDEIKTKSTELNSKLSNYVEDNEGIPTHDDIEIFNELGELFADDYWSMEHLNVLSEMKIIYLFKSVEITMKSLIHTGYPKINTKDFFQWDVMASYFKSINIKISDFNGYVEVTELRKVNNSIKHNNTINDDINKISEFTGETQFTYINTGRFHKRIKPKIQNFIKSLGQAIISDLYDFDDNRIEKISDDFKLRMNEDSLKIFANKLTNGKKPKE